MTPRQEAIALITAAEDSEAQRILWLGKENSAFAISLELAHQARAAIELYAHDNGVEVPQLLARMGLTEAAIEAKRLA